MLHYTYNTHSKNKWAALIDTNGFQNTLQVCIWLFTSYFHQFFPLHERKTCNIAGSVNLMLQSTKIKDSTKVDKIQALATYTPPLKHQESDSNSWTPLQHQQGSQMGTLGWGLTAPLFLQSLFCTTCLHATTTQCQTLQPQWNTTVPIIQVSPSISFTLKNPEIQVA
jgi:hypothetical protein